MMEGQPEAKRRAHFEATEGRRGHTAFREGRNSTNLTHVGHRVQDMESRTEKKWPTPTSGTGGERRRGGAKRV